MRPELTRVSLEDFLDLVTQRRKVFARYQRFAYTEVVCYEFLLPVTRGDRLREALDALFYADTIRQRIHEIGLGRLEDIVPRPQGHSDGDYISDIIASVSSLFGGYSVSQVNGRFRDKTLLTLAEAGTWLVQGRKYLMDEDTAVVRFIVPIAGTKLEFGADPRSVSSALGRLAVSADARDGLARELLRVRELFFHFFAEAVVRTVHGEDEIWLLETGPERRLYVWERSIGPSAG